MRSPIVAYLRGSVKVEVRGKRQHELINQLIAKKMTIWNIKPLPNGTTRLELFISDFFRLRTLLKETGCRIHIIERYGFPFFVARIGRRKFFAAGMIFFVLGLYLLSSIVWEVNVEGNERIDRQTVIAAAKKHGIYPMQWKFRMSSPAELSKQLLSELPDASWIGVNIVGTKVHIKVVESTMPEKRPLLSPRHLVSTSDAVVTKIVAEQGRPRVQPNTRVKRGDVLISGILGNEEQQRIVVAKGTVYGLVWYEYAIEVPLKLNYKVYTGNWHTRKYATFGNRGLRLTGYGKPKYEHQEIIEQRSGLHWRDVKLPIGWLEEKVMEVNIVEQTLQPEEAKAIALQQARAELLLVAGEDAEIKEQKILHERTESGKVYMKVLFEVNQQITKEQPIVPNNLDDNQGE